MRSIIDLWYSIQPKSLMNVVGVWQGQLWLVISHLSRAWDSKLLHHWSQLLWMATLFHNLAVWVTPPATCKARSQPLCSRTWSWLLPGYVLLTKSHWPSCKPAEQRQQCCKIGEDQGLLASRCDQRWPYIGSGTRSIAQRSAIPFLTSHPSMSALLKIQIWSV